MKAKRILSLVLSAAMILSLFCMVPSMSASAEGETRLYASTYGSLINYSVSSNETTSDGQAPLVGGMGLDNNDNMQTYASMVENGYTDRRFVAGVTFRVRAAAAGTYTLTAKIAPGGNIGAGYFVAMGVNDKRFYKQDVEGTGSKDVPFTVELDKGVNLVRVFTRLGETQTLVQGGSWVYFDSLMIPAGLEGLEKGTAAVYKAQDAHYKNYDASGDTNVGGAGAVQGELYARQFTYDNFKIGNINQSAYLSYTVTVPEDGYYDLAVSANTSTVGAEGYINAFVDATKTKIFYKHVDSWSTKNISLYIPAGTHVVTFTNVWGATAGGEGANGYTSWCDYGQFTSLNGDVVLAETGIDPRTISDPTRVEAGVEGGTFKFGDPLQDGGPQASGATKAGGIGFDNSKSQHIGDSYIDKSNVAHATFAITAPADGTYTVIPIYEWGAANTIPDKSINLIVNGNTVYNVPFKQSGSSAWNCQSVELELKKGNNIVHFVPFTRESNTDGSWMNVDCLDLYDGLTQTENTTYTKFEAEDALADNIRFFHSGIKTESISFSDGTSENVTFTSGADVSNMFSSGITAEAFKTSALANMPYVAVTVDAPADGYYEITASVRTGGDWAEGRLFYAMLVKDGEPEAHTFNRSTAGKPFMPSDLNTTADRTAIDFTTYLTAGTHILAFTTCVRGAQSLNVDTDYAYVDYDGFYLGNGLTAAAEQVRYVVDNNYFTLEDAAYRNLYQKIYYDYKDAGFEGNKKYANYIAGSPPKSAAESFDKMSKYLDTHQTPFIAYALDAPEAGEYVINIRYKFAAGGQGSVDLTNYYKETGEYPYAAVVVNEGDTFKLSYSPMDAEKNIYDAWWQTGAITANLKAGTNIIYLMGPTRDMRNAFVAPYIDYGMISTSLDLTRSNVDLYALGEASGDKLVNANDVLRVKKYLANSSTTINFANADLDGNGSINSTDLATIKKMVVNPASVGSLTWLKVKNRDNSGYTVTRSNPDNSVFLVQDKAVVKSSRTSGMTEINVNTGSVAQTLDGFGASLTDSTAQNMAMLTNSQLDEVMNNLFSSNKGDALGIDILRQPVGASDFADPLYTYDDMPQGQTDTSLSHFSIAHDTTPIVSTNKLDGNTNNGHSMISLINKAQQTSGNNIMFIATAWTAPLWMKTSWSWNSLGGNTLNSKYYGVYADYFVKYLKAYKDQGIDISYLSPQNEASAKHGITSMYMSHTMMNDFVSNNLYGKISSYNSQYGKNVGLLGFDFNPHIWDIDHFLSSTMMNNYYAGAALHAYSGSGVGAVLDFRCIDTLRSNYPNDKVFITEGAGNTSRGDYKDGKNAAGSLVTYWNFANNYFVNVNRTTNALRRGAHAFVYWNIMLDEEIGPASADGGGNGWGIGLLGFNRHANDYYMTEDYYALAHYSKFMDKGSQIIATNDTAGTLDFNGLNNVASKNKDGSYSMVINNDTGFDRPVSINTGLGYYIEYTVPARSSVSLNWTASQLAAYVQ